MKITSKVEDFVRDPSFRDWVHGDLNAGAFWTDWLTRHPNQQPKITQARIMVRAQETVNAPLDEEEVNKQINRLLERTSVVRAGQVIGDKFTPVWSLPDRWLRMVAVLLTTLGLGAGYYLLRQADESILMSLQKLTPDADPKLTKRAGRKASSSSTDRFPQLPAARRPSFGDE